MLGNPETSAVRGGTALHRVIGSMTRAFGWQDSAVIEARGLRLAIDLLDLRMSEAIDEVRKDLREIRILQSVLGSGDTFLDVGANHGTYAVQLAQTVGPAGRVIAFEPQPRLASLIRRSFADNGFRHAEVLEIGCGDARATTTFYVPSGHSGAATLYRDFAAGAAVQPITVRIERLDDVLAGETLPGRVAMKLDVEGAEVAALRGAIQFLRQRRPLVVFEINPTSLCAAGRTLADLVAVFRDAGYERYAELDDYPQTRSLDELVESTQRNAVCL